MLEMDFSIKVKWKGHQNISYQQSFKNMWMNYHQLHSRSEETKEGVLFTWWGRSLWGWWSWVCSERCRLVWWCHSPSLQCHHYQSWLPPSCLSLQHQKTRSNLATNSKLERVVI